jgi:hypothetical protein
MSRTRSRKNYEDDDDLEDSDEESGSDTDEMQDIAALVMDRLMEPKLDSSFLEKVEFGLSMVNLESTDKWTQTRFHQVYIVICLLHQRSSKMRGVIQMSGSKRSGARPICMMG